jgi:hypothetical protein
MNPNSVFVDIIYPIFFIPLHSFIKVAAIISGDIQLELFSETVPDLKAIQL